MCLDELAFRIVDEAGRLGCMARELREQKEELE
jgi:hypothetical protein